ncbi:MAG: putative tail tubular protein [Prokaryotic dsDNA virus sp.]|nr:MAG: putative tail tubular protein [Prokaryotic dsDNA virus sp.]|tara:strand:+ start:3402 stop:3977 length:576 start_codon:yes stop_codon:yes gene_type:complete
MALTSKLEAVNTMIGVIGESPINSISGSSLPVSVVTALNVLDEVNREVQSEGWHYNTEHIYPLVRDSSNKFNLPSNTLKIDVPIDKYNDIDLVQRGTTLYDRKNHTDVFSEDLDVSITFELTFEELPQQFRNYITIRSARKFANRFLGSPEIESFTLRDEINAKATAIDSDSENADRNIFDNFDVLRVIDR